MSPRRALVAVDLGAESCRVSLLQWRADAPVMRMVHRFANGPVARGRNLYWDLERICHELERALQQCAELAPEGIASIGVTGWAVDYVRLAPDGKPVAQPFCYRDARTHEAMAEVHTRIGREKLYAITGVQIQPINTIYQLYADHLSGIPASTPWVSLPEYILHWLGAPRVAEYTNATHTALLDTSTKEWAAEIFEALDFDLPAAPELVSPGTMLGPVSPRLRALPAFRDAQLVAPACHDTASAIAGIPAHGKNWAYISSGTWSLVGTLLPSPRKAPDACHDGFTNLGAATGETMFHRGIPGMWILRQCMNEWEKTAPCSVEALIEEAQKLPPMEHLLDLDDDAFLALGNMPRRINEQLASRGVATLPEGCGAAPTYANLIFRSLAERYASVLRRLHSMTGKQFDRICAVGGGSRNEFLNNLTAEASGVPVQRWSAESSTLGNFAVQWARLEHVNATIEGDMLMPFVSLLNTVAPRE